ncbi:MAG: GDP-mannose 4,6-dehydratase [Leptospirales bacterium]
MNTLITGAAVFIRSSLAHRLLEEGHNVFGIDNLKDYYEVSLKEARLKRLMQYTNFRFQKSDISNRKETLEPFEQNHFPVVYNLSARVRYALENPFAYIDTNLTGFEPTTPIEEGIRKFVDWSLEYHEVPAVQALSSM